MNDMLPFPNITSSVPEKQIADIINYLIQFKETLEFILTSISSDNLSPELKELLYVQGTNTQESTLEQIEQIAHNTLSVSDVVNSEIFNSAVISKIANIEFTVNFNTGYLEYSAL